MTGDEAMTAYAHGDAKAFAIVYDAVAPRLEGYLRKRVSAAARVEDIIQQTFLQMHTARGAFIPGSEVLPWAFAIAKHIMIDSQRKTWREESHDLSSNDDVHARKTVSGAATAEEVVQAGETGKRLSAAYAHLTEPQRTAFDLREQGLSCAEIAGVLGTSITGVKLRMHRAVRALRLAFGDERSTPRPPPAKGAP